MPPCAYVATRMLYGIIGVPQKCHETTIARSAELPAGTWEMLTIGRLCAIPRSVLVRRTGRNYHEIFICTCSSTVCAGIERL